VARNFKDPRAAEPELDAKSLAFPRHELHLCMRPADGRQADFSLRCLKVNLRLLRAFDQEVVFRRGGQKAHGFDTLKLSFRMARKSEVEFDLKRAELQVV
jgi:hypothetical protein